MLRSEPCSPSTLTDRVSGRPHVLEELMEQTLEVTEATTADSTGTEEVLEEELLVEEISIDGMCGVY